MDALLASTQTLRGFLLSAAADANCCDPHLCGQIDALTDPEVVYALDHTFVKLSELDKPAPRLPSVPWGTAATISHAELIYHVIERLLARKSTTRDDANVLTLGYRQATPGIAGHRVTQLNGVVCYYPNTLVTYLKKTHWESLHRVMGDHLLVHLLLNYVILVELPNSRRTFVQVAGRSVRQSILTSMSSAGEARRSVSLNDVLYARLAHRSSIFETAHVLVRASKRMEHGQISRGEASRVLRSIFDIDPKEKRLPKRLVNLIPLVQEMARRFRDCDLHAMADEIVPVPPPFRKFMSEHPHSKQTSSARKRASSNAIDDVDAFVTLVAMEAMDAGYLSQCDENGDDQEWKRKRREDTVSIISNASVQARKKQKVDSVSHIARPSSSTPSLTKLQQHKAEIQVLLECTSSKRQVYRLVRKVMVRVVPKHVWGDSDAKGNYRLVKQLVRKLIFARKYDVLSLEKCVHAFQVTKIAWMNKQKITQCPPNEQNSRRSLLVQFLQWTVSSLVFPVLRSLFYITESEGMANEIVYYRRPVWSTISQLALIDLEGSILAPREANQPDERRCLATSRLRLLPKPSGVRPLMNLSSPATTGRASVNQALDKVHRVLSFEIDRQPKRLIGSAVRNVDEIYDRLRELLNKVSSCSQCLQPSDQGDDATKLYCVTVDIERCFDTIRSRKLYRMVKKALSEDEYLIRKYWVGQQLNSASDVGKVSETPGLFFKMERPAFSSGDLQSFDLLAERSNKSNSVFVDGVIYDYLDRVSIMKLLKEHLFANTVQVDHQEYVQRQGIPQGSVLSTTLCNIYYGQFERKCLCKAIPERPAFVSTADARCHHEALLRYTDDWLFITTDLKRADKFCQIMHQGNDDYGCHVNVAKSQVNFLSVTKLADSSTRAVPRFDGAGTTGLLSWCGILIDPVELQVYVNYEKSCSALVQGSIPLDETKPMRRFFVNKVVSTFRQRWHPLYFGPAFLKQDTIQVNLFQMLCLSAHRFVLLVDMLPFVNVGMEIFHESIQSILKKTAKGIHRSITKADRRGVDPPSAEHERQSYAQLRHQVFKIGHHCFRLVFQSRLDRQRPPHGAAANHWRALIQRLQRTAPIDKRKKGSCDGEGDINLDLLTGDTRNSRILDQVLERTIPM